MAQPIKETPVLRGDDVRRFVERMNETRVESDEKNNAGWLIISWQ